MFAQEAKNKVQANVDYVYAYLLSGYTCIMECLNAQLYTSGLSDKSGLSQRDLNKICDNATDITREMNTLMEVVFGTPKLTRHMTLHGSQTQNLRQKKAEQLKSRFMTL